MSLTEKELQEIHPRTLDSICRDAKEDKHGCRYEPLLHIELDHVVPDELHLLLRIMDILIRNAINSAIGCDNHTTRGRGSDDTLKGPMLTKFQKAVNDCGVKFTITKKEGKLEWSSLVGPDKLKFLNKLPEAFQEYQTTRYIRNGLKIVGGVYV